MSKKYCLPTRGVTFRLMSAKCLALKPSKLSLMGAFLEEYLVLKVLSKEDSYKVKPITKVFLMFKNQQPYKQ